MTERERWINLVCEGMAESGCGLDCNLPSKQYCDRCVKTTDYLLNNGAIIPPVKCRNKVYTIILNKVEEYEVASYTVDADGFSFIHLAYEQNGNIYGRTLSIDDFNKKFYLTREEAEKALKERRNATI